LKDDRVVRRPCVLVAHQIVPLARFVAFPHRLRTSQHTIRPRTNYTL
jgi:hypothetical protein